MVARRQPDHLPQQPHRRLRDLVDGPLRRNLVNLTNNPATNDNTAEWSPDGTKIAFTRGAGATSEIYVMNADGSNPVNMTNRAGYDSIVTWSPDGTTLIWSRTVPDTNFSVSGANYEVFSMNAADGSNLTRLTDSFDFDGRCDWQRLCTIYAGPDGVAVGTEGDDVICGTPGNDRLAGMGGNDLILGFGGDDQISGGPGDDTIFGGLGADSLDGGPGLDFLSGGAGQRPDRGRGRGAGRPRGRRRPVRGRPGRGVPAPPVVSRPSGLRPADGARTGPQQA